MASKIKHKKHGWEQTRTKRDGTIIKETGKYSEDGKVLITTKEIQNSVEVENK